MFSKNYAFKDKSDIICFIYNLSVTIEVIRYGSHHHRFIVKFSSTIIGVKVIIKKERK